MPAALVKRLLPLVLSPALGRRMHDADYRRRGMSAVRPQLSVERFRQPANARDLDAISRAPSGPSRVVRSRRPVSGVGLRTVQGDWRPGSDHGRIPARANRTVELRMHAISAVMLQHDDYEVFSDQNGCLGGRCPDNPGIRRTVRRGERRSISDVGLLVIRSVLGLARGIRSSWRRSRGVEAAGRRPLSGFVPCWGGLPLQELDERAAGSRSGGGTRPDNHGRSWSGLMRRWAETPAADQPIEFRTHVLDAERHMMEGRAGAVEETGDRTYPGSCGSSSSTRSDETDMSTPCSGRDTT